MEEIDDIWVFLSHSYKDYERVRDVRNLLEEHDFRPIMFFLKCLDDNDELDSLIKREIDSRKRFILCDSENAKASEWIGKEVAYIKSKQRYYYTIDINKPIELISQDIMQFIRESTVFISCSINDFKYFTQLKSMLYNDLGLKVIDLQNELNNCVPYSSQIYNIIDNCLSNGYVLFFITDAFLRSEYCLNELRYVLDKDNIENVIFLIANTKLRSNMETLSDIPFNKKIYCRCVDDNIVLDRSRMYWFFMQQRIKEASDLGDAAALYWNAYHYYMCDDRFDGEQSGLRLGVLKMVKRSMESGYELAKELYDDILKDYPELKKMI